MDKGKIRGYCTSALTGVSLLSGGLLLSAAAQAEDLMATYALAKQSDPTYQSGLYQASATTARYDQAKAALLPSLDLTASRMQTRQNIISSDNEVFASGDTNYPTRSYGLSLRQSIYSYANWAGLSLAEAQLAQADAERAGLEQDLVLRVAERYFVSLAAAEDLDATRAAQLATDHHFRLVQAKKGRGLARETDLLDAQARLMQSQSKTVASQSDVNDALQMLQEMTGTMPRALQLLKADAEFRKPEPADPEAWLTQALESNPELMRRQAAVEAAREGLKREKGGHYPTFDLVYSYDDRDTDGTLFGGGSHVRTQEVGVEFKVPIYSGGFTSSRVREATDLLSKAEQDLEIERRAVRRQVFAAYDGVLTESSRIQALGKSVEAYSLAVDAKSLAYNSGLTSSLAVLDAERDLYFARTEYARARYAYLINIIRLKRAVGLLNEGDLVEINALLDSQALDIGELYRRS